MCVGAHMPLHTCWGKDNLLELVLSFYHVGPGD